MIGRLLLSALGVVAVAVPIGAELAPGTRPIGPGMSMEIETAAQITDFTTGNFASREGDGAGQVEYLPTTIISRTREGVVTRRLTEEYSTGYLTAVRGVFESPDGPDGWTVVQEFELAEVRR